MSKRYHITITGHVQGVFFRLHVEKYANILGLAGWVQNKADGSVEVIAEGKEYTLKKFVEACKKGSDASRVDGVVVEEQDVTGEFSGFEIKR
jgi:acylphosphatase